ncbi:protein FAR1-RELATED SEQUENCE 5-like [Ipomoea triloba]|uniref:protein FAR1-RELATED SEQUENCE 5-like n=1 Tax=Ipomoea triloba TaxID=35885 RepID=UPI00125D4AB3|nr:protein FAR1-RELATED SEQUENCE 5-like [Ipomoea triloba]
MGPSDHTVEMQTCDMEESADVLNYWMTTCDPSLKLVVGQRFESLESGIKFYIKYASAAGFDVRRSTEIKNKYGVSMKKYLVCSREGYKEAKDTDLMESGAPTHPKRRLTSNRVGCIAKIIFRLNGEVYEVVSFEERHTHDLCGDSYKPFMKVNRKLDIGHQHFIANCAKANIWPSKTFNLGGDSQMVLSNYIEKKSDCDDFYFEYEVNEKDQLSRVFWADGVARKQFSVFGEAMAFDATYQTNKYKLVFVPFTGVDHHKRCVTFAAGLIAREDEDSYRWLLINFKKAMGKTPPITITDQDPAIKVAIVMEFLETRYRFCMWHIMTKVGDKVEVEMAKNTEFRRALNSVVWNENCMPEEFENGWNGVVHKYGLHENGWLKLMYEQRESWIPAYFQDMFMGGLLRITSRSESENSVFRSNTSKHLCLVEFFYQFERTINRQRSKQAELDAACNGHLPALKTPLSVEREAASIYTLAIFYQLQGEIIGACFSCRVRSFAVSEPTRTYVIEDDKGKSYTVVVENGSNNISCTCRMYRRIGLLCRHALVILKDERFDHIPPQHITPRWTRDAVPKTRRDLYACTQAEDL